MDGAHVRALATELETTLGLLSELIGELESQRSAWPRSGRVAELVHRLAARADLGELPAVLLRAHLEIIEILGGIRLTREAIEAHTIERIRETKNKLSDVSITTESATLELLNGLDRSLELIDSLEAQANGAASADGFQNLRGQVSALYNHLQFQDITAQQLQGVNHSLLEVETRVAAVAALFDRALAREATEHIRTVHPEGSPARLAFNPDATMHRTRADQAMVDETFQEARRESPGRPGCANHDIHP